MRDPNKWTDHLFPEEPKGLTSGDWAVLVIAAVVQFYGLYATGLQIKQWLFN